MLHYYLLSLQECKTKSPTPTSATNKCARRNRELNSQYDRMLGTEVTAAPTCACPAPSPGRQLGTESTFTQSPAPTSCSTLEPLTEAPVVPFVAASPSPSSAPSCAGKPDCPDVPFVITPPPAPTPCDGPGCPDVPGITTPPPAPTPCNGPDCPPDIITLPPSPAPSVCPPCPDETRTDSPTRRPTP